MIIKYEYSHLNGLEHLMVHKPQLLEEIRSAIAAIDANQHTKTSKDKTKTGKTLYSQKDLNAGFIVKIRYFYTRKRFNYEYFRRN